MSLGATPKRRRATKEDAPQSTRNVLVLALIQIQVCKRPPLPKASPLPKNWTLTVSIVGTSDADKSHNTLVGPLYAQYFIQLISIIHEM